MGPRGAGGGSGEGGGWELSLPLNLLCVHVVGGSASSGVSGELSVACGRSFVCEFHVALSVVGDVSGNTAVFLSLFRVYLLGIGMIRERV